MTQAIKKTNMMPETGKVTSFDEYKKLTGDEQLQQIIQSAIAGALGQVHLDNPIPDPPNAEESTMTTIDPKMKRCCIPTEFGNIWVQGRTIPQMCQAFHEKMRMLEGVSASQADANPASPLFEDYAQEWWDTFEAKRLGGGTKIDYEMNLHKHVIPYFRGKRLKDITTKDVQGFYDERAAYSNSTCRHWRTLLYGIFNSAIEDGLLEKNPAKSIRLTMSKKKKERLPISREEAAGIEANLHLLEGKDLLLLSILLYTGVRRGEMLGLRWEDIDFERKLIHIRRQITFINNRPVEKATKSQAGLREVPMLPELERILLANKPEDASSTNYVVDGEEALSERSFRNTWARICKKVQIPKGVTPHVLRHTFLTQLQATGRVDIKTLQSIAGHSKITMTMNTYVHREVGNVEKVSRDNAGLFTRT